MLFNSYEFILFFLPAVFVVYFLLSKARLTVAAKAWLGFASILFYAYWNVRYLPLLLGSIFFNYAVGTTLGKYRFRPPSKKAVLLSGIGFNVLLLGYYKYADFFISSINAVSSTSYDLWRVVLPLGISFFTFTQIAFLVDSYKGTAREYDFLNYILFVTFFPHLIAGPIIHHKEMMPQFDLLRNKVLNWKNLSHGIFLFSLGLFKKVAIADFLAKFAARGFDGGLSLTFLEAWVTSLSFTFQLYYDFSGYTDMALGAALMFNIRLPVNFNTPYRSVNIQDFWRRWHITLSRFLRDYIYFPMGGNRKGEFRTYVNLLATFLIGGIWHGAGWTFFFWGFLHGIAAIVHRTWTKTGLRMHKALGWGLTFIFVNICWVFFRSRTMKDAFRMLEAMTGNFDLSLSNIQLSKMSAVFFIMVSASAVFSKNSQELSGGLRPNLFQAFSAVAMFIVAVLQLADPSEFLYFNF